jgi:hypothetical protein
VRDAGMTTQMADARRKTLKMPFDCQRMNFGGFSPIVEKGSRLAVRSRVDAQAPADRS